MKAFLFSGASAFVLLMILLGIAPGIQAQCPQLHAVVSNGPLVNMCSNAPVRLLAEPSTSDYSYQWQQQLSVGEGFKNITGATASDYTASEPASYRVLISNGTCSDTSSITSLVHLQLSAGTISGGPTSPICADSYVGSLAGPSVPGDEAGLVKYQWQMKVGDGNFVNIPQANGLEYNAGYVKNTTTYRRAISDNCGNEVYSNELTFSIFDQLKPGILQPEMQSVNTTDVPATISAATPATGSGNFSYSWQYSLSVNGPWITISGANSASYTPTPLNITTYFRRVVSTDVCSYVATSEPVLVTILNPVILNAGILYSDNSCLFPGNTPYPIATKLPPTGGVLPYLIEWEAKTETGDWAVIPGEHNPKLYPGPITQTTYYRKKVTDAVGSIAYTDVAMLSVITGALDAGEIAATAKVACMGSSPGQIISVKSGANFGEKGGYQWQVKTAGSDWVNIPGATRGYYQPQPLTENSTFRRVFFDQCGPNQRTAYSNEVVIDTKPALLPGDISPSTQMVLPGRTPRLLASSVAPSGGTNSYTISWEKLMRL